MNIASVPCRCGHSCAALPRAASGTSGSSGATGTTSTSSRAAAAGAADELGAVGGPVGGGEPHPGGPDGGQQAGLAAGSGAHVQPGPVGSVEGGAGEQQRRKLAALVLHRGRAGADGGQPAGV